MKWRFESAHGNKDGDTIAGQITELFKKEQSDERVDEKLDDRRRDASGIHTQRVGSLRSYCSVGIGGCHVFGRMDGDSSLTAIQSPAKDGTKLFIEKKKNNKKIMAKIDKHVWCCVSSDKWKSMDISEQNRFVAEHANNTLLKLVHMDEAADTEKELKRNYNIKGHYLLTNEAYGNDGCMEFSMRWSRNNGVSVLKRL